MNPSASGARQAEQRRGVASGDRLPVGRSDSGAVQRGQRLRIPHVEGAVRPQQHAIRSHETNEVAQRLGRVDHRVVVKGPQIGARRLCRAPALGANRMPAIEPRVGGCSPLR